MLDPSIKQLATSKNFGTFCVNLPNGQIASHVMWVDATDEHLLINTEVHRAKYRAVEANPNVTVTVWNAENPYQYGEVRGTVAGEVRGPEARAHIDSLAQKYTRLRLRQPDPERAGDPPDRSGAATHDGPVIRRPDGLDAGDAGDRRRHGFVERLADDVEGGRGARAFRDRPRSEGGQRPSDA